MDVIEKSEHSDRKDVINMVRKLLKAGIALCCTYLLLAAVAGVVIAELSLKLHRRPIQHRAEAATLVRQRYHTDLQEVAIRAVDGAELRAWYVHPSVSNSGVVILLHGITDNREGVAGYGELFRDHGFALPLS